MSIQLIQWEDIRRDKNSCWGSRISDMTLYIKTDDSISMCSVIRADNFSDKTMDVNIEHFNVELDDKIIALSDLFKNYGVYDARDKKGILLQTQCCMLPVMSQQSDVEVRTI